MSPPGGPGRRVGVLVGLAEEAALVRACSRHWPLPPLVTVGGGTAEAARHRLPELLAEAPEVLLSFGYCGGLTSGLVPGTLVIPEAVVDAGGRRWTCDTALVRTLRAAARAAGLAPVGGTILGSEAPAGSRRGKQALAEASSAVAIDLESHVAAALAGEAGLPFAGVRAVLDDAGTELPPLALDAVDPETGRPRLGRLLAGLLARPGQLPAFIRLGRANAAAKASLRRLLGRPLVL